MLRKLKHDLEGNGLAARDGRVGKLQDAYFDDEDWSVRYLVVDTGKWLPGRRFLLAPSRVRAAEADELSADLGRAEVERAPGLDADPPVSQLMREARGQRYGNSYDGPFLWNPTLLGAPAGPWIEQPSPRDEALAREIEARAAHSHLRSGNEVIGYAVRARDGDIGHIDDFMVDDESWSIRAVVVDTRNWLPGLRVFVAAGEIAALDWQARVASVRLSRAEIEHAPRVR